MGGHSLTSAVFAAIAALLMSRPASAADVLLDGGAGLQWRIIALNSSSWALGQPLLKGTAVDSPVDDAIAYWRRMSDEFVIPVTATSLVVDADKAGANLSGSTVLPSGGPGNGPTSTQVSLRVALQPGFAAAVLSLAFSSSAGATGWQLCVKYMHDGPPAAQPWRVAGYPQAGNSSDYSGNQNYMGWPGFWLYRPDASVVSFYSLAATDDYNNPTTWTGSTIFTFKTDTGHQVAPQYLFGGAGLQPAQVYAPTLHLLFSTTGETLAAARELVPALLQLNGYAVESMPLVRSKEDGLACFVNARRTTPMWRTTPSGQAYQLQDIASFIYLGTTPESAYFEYQLFAATNDTFWRARAFAQMAFWLQGQNTNASSRHYGAVHTTYNLPSGPYNSDDRGNNRGWKIDLNSHMARYALLLWEAVRAHEGADMSAWYAAAQAAAQWVHRMAAAQATQGPPGSAGFPQRIVPDTDAPTPSVVSGRTMNALPAFARLLPADDAAYNFSALRSAAEGWLAAGAEGLLYFSGQHPDLPYYDYEQDSVWETVEYWLDTSAERAAAGDAAGAAAALDRAVGDAYVALLMLCPKQLSWVQNPTQMAADEQQMYSQYSVYTYHNRKWLALVRLAAATGTPLWGQLADRLFQLNMYTQVVAGAADDVGGYHEAIADPWLARGGGYNFMGSVYLNELALDLSLQLLVYGTAPTPGYTNCTIPA